MQTDTKAIKTVTTVNRLWAAAFMSAAACVLVATPAFAAWDSITTVLCNIVNDEIMGNIGRGLATLGILAIAASAILGKASWAMAVTVVVGIGILYGANSLAMTLVGGNCL